MTSAATASLLERLLERIKSELPDLVAVYRFGSWGTPNERPDSDVDLAVLSLSPLPAVERWELAQRLAAIGGRDVDLVDLRGASTVLAAQVVSSGERLYCAHSDLCEEFEDRAYAAYARLNEERRPILQDIHAKGSVHGG